MSSVIVTKCYTSSFLKITNFSIYDPEMDVMMPRVKVNWGTICGLVPEGMSEIDNEHSGYTLHIVKDCYIYAYAEYDIISCKWIKSKLILTEAGTDWEVNPPEESRYRIQYHYKLIGSVILKNGVIHKILSESGNVTFSPRPVITEKPLQIIDATEEEGKPKIRIKWGTIANLQPDGFEPGDFPGYFVDIKDNCYVYAAALLNTEKMIWQRSWIEVSTSAQRSSSTVAYKLIGSVQVFNNSIVSIANQNSGDVTLGLQDLYLYE